MNIQIKKYDEHADECIDSIFPYEIYLSENKRLKSDEDKAKLKQILKNKYLIKMIA